MAVVVGAVMLGVVPGTVAADHASSTDNRIQIVDATKNTTSGNTTVDVRATTSDPVSDVQFTYDNGTEFGPLTFANDGIVAAAYSNDTAFTSGDSFVAGDNETVTFELNQNWESGQVQLNASAEGQSYASADAANRSVLTTNVYNVSLVDAGGSPITGATPVFVTNGSSGTLNAHVLATGGTAVFHCGGVFDGATCSDPDTASPTHTYAMGGTIANGPKGLPTDLRVQAFELPTANGSAQRSLTPSDLTLTANQSASPTVFNVTDYANNLLSVNSIRIENRTTGSTVQNWVAGTSPDGPIYLEAKTDYDVVIDHASGTARRALTIPTKGVSNTDLRVAGGAVSTSEVVGQVLNESGEPVPNVTVSAEPASAYGDLPSYNSTSTDANGLFTMELPETETAEGRPYQFALTSSQTDGGTLSYFPTRADNDGDGYTVRESRTILAPLELRQGGEVDISVTNKSGGQIGSQQSLTSLSQTTTATSLRTRESLVSAFGLFGFFGTSVTSAEIRVPSPTTGVQDDVSYTVWGLSPSMSGVSVGELCADQVGVSQGDRTDSDCALAGGGTLDITLDQYGSIVDRNNPPEAVPVGSVDGYARNVLIVRNATSGNVTTYLGPGSIQQFFAADGDDTTLSLPVPAGNYTVEIRPARGFIDRTSVRNTTTVQVESGATGTVNLDSGRDFGMELIPGRTDRTLSRTDDNEIAVRVRDPVSTDRLTDSEVNVSVRLLYGNGTVAEPATPLSYNSTDKSFETTTYRPSVQAGGYGIELTATHENGNSTYNTTIRDGVLVSDFATEVRTARQTVEVGETFDVNVRAYNLTADPPAGIGADASNVSLQLLDSNGNAIASKTAGSKLKDGEGSFTIPAVPDTGRYQLAVRVTADDATHEGQQGVAITRFRVSEYDLDVSVDKSVYRPGETVEATVSLTNSTTGAAVQGATVETRFGFGFENGTVTRASATTADGEATFELAPSQLYTDDTWESSTYMAVRATVDTGSRLARVRAGEFIDVRAFQADASADQPRYASDESPTINVVIPPGVSVDASNVTATQLDGNEIEQTATKVDDRFYQITLNSQPEGDHRVLVEVTNDAGRTVTDRARFGVASVTVGASTDARRYGPSEAVTITATVRHPNGSAVSSGRSVDLGLERGRTRVQVNSTTETTNASGMVQTTFSPGKTGVHVVNVSTGGSQTAFPILVTDLKTVFTDGEGTSVGGYEFTPGQSDATISVEATSGGTDIDGNVTVYALIDGSVVTLGEEAAPITSGTGSVTFSIPSSANTGTVPVEAVVESNAGAFNVNTTTIELVAGSSTLSLAADSNVSVVEPGGGIRLRGSVTQGGQPVDGKQVRFTLLSESAERDLGTATSSDGTATLETSVPSDLTTGEYGIRATLVDQGTDAYDGVFVSDTQLSIDTNESAYTTGETILANLSATADGTAVTGASGRVRVRLADGSTVTESYDSSDNTGGSYYEVPIQLPEDDAAIGTRTVEAFARDGSSIATASTTVDVFNATESASLSVPETIVANGSGFEVTGNASVATTGTLTVYSPGTKSVAYEETLNLNATTQLSLADPGTYVFVLSVDGVGTETVVRNADGGTSAPELSVGESDLSTNTTAFTASEDVYIWTDTGNMTATVLSPDDSFTVSLNRESGGTNYGVLSASDTSTGPYLVRLDGPNATDVDSTLIEVGSS